MNEITAALLTGLSAALDLPYALLGQCVGGLIAF
jgi:surfactin synthase thioesterase subunit